MHVSAILGIPWTLSKFTNTTQIDAAIAHFIIRAKIDRKTFL